VGKDSRDIIRELEADGMALYWRERQPPPFQAPGDAREGDGAASAPGLASEDVALDLSSSRIEGTAVSAMAGYIALVHKDEGTSYGVSFPDVPGCIAAGDTFEEAVANAAEALAAHFVLMKADGDTIPAPRSFDALRRDREFTDDSSDAIVTMVTPRTEMAVAE
jgi:predicted RNase H-like HicB family nuclease